MDMNDEVLILNVYNTIKKTEITFGRLKTDLNLCLIHHKKDESSKAHLNVGLLAYWLVLVNTIRYQSKTSKINNCWNDKV